MSTSTQTDQDLSRREEMTVSSAAMSAAPWGAATVTGTTFRMPLNLAEGTHELDARSTFNGVSLDAYSTATSALATFAAPRAAAPS